MNLVHAPAPVPAERLPALLRAMPKAELHIHIEGSLEPEQMFALAQRNGLALAYPSAQAVRQAYVFDKLQSFLDIYHAGTQVLRTEQDFYDMACAYLARASADNVLHAEIFFDTQTHTAHGVPAEDVVNGLHRACTDAPVRYGMTAALILCFLRHLPEAESFACLEQVLPLRDKILG
ncbi:MAG: adenosine deaminase family protein, partial [Rhodoferax sp.]